MKRFALTGCLLVIFLIMIAPTAMAAMTYEVKTWGGSGFGPYAVGLGGEYTLRIVNPDPQWALNDYSSDTKNQILPSTTWGNQPNGRYGSFQTFCVETSEFIYGKTTVDATLNTETVFGGKPLTLGAAWLYDKFATGTLSGYDYNLTGNDVSGRKASASALQNAIWYEMGLGASPELSGFKGNYYTDLVDQQSWGGSAMDPNMDISTGKNKYPVEILNLWVPGHDDQKIGARQDVLVMVPEPSPLLFFGLTLIVLAGVSTWRLRRS